MEYYPFHVFITDDPWTAQILRKEGEIDSVFDELVETNPCLLKNLNRLDDWLLLIAVEFEIKLPRANGVGDFAILVRECQADLNHFGFFHILFDEQVLGLFLRVDFLIEFALWEVDSRELCVLGELAITIAMTLNLSASFISFSISS